MTINYRPIILLILALAFIRGVLYASLVPPWQAPDEPAQFERALAARSAAEWNTTPTTEPDWYDDLRDSLFTYRFADYLFFEVSEARDQSLSSYIHLYHYVYDGLYSSRFAYQLVGLPLMVYAPTDIILGLYMVRIYTVLLAVGVVYLAFVTVRTLFPGNPFMIIGVPLFIMLHPQHTHLMAAVNNGNLTELLVTATFCLLVVGLMRGFSWITLGAMFGVAALALWTKATAYFLVIPLGWLGVLYLLRYRKRWPWFVGGMLVLPGLYFAPERLKILVSESINRLLAGEFFFDSTLLPSIFQTFWAVPGWANVQLPVHWYQMWGVACGLAAIGWVVALGVRRRQLADAMYKPQLEALSVLAVAILAAFGIQVGWHILTGTLHYNHGRSLYPVMVPLSIFLLWGWQHLLPRGWHKPGLLALGMALFLFDSVVLFNYIVPFFYSRY